MATELGVAYLSLAASTDGFAKDVKKAMGDAEGVAGDTGKRAGSRLGSGIKTGMKVAGGAILGVTGLVAGLALKGGISRALAIEDAQAKLEGLGHSTESIQTIMDSALDSVRGTAFGLGDAASVAATVVAAGVAPGEDLTRTLKLVADASTIAGTSMGDMGAIFNKVAGTGKIQGEVIAQLGERGIPILALLADELGVTAGEVSKMASEGKIDFATFQDAMEAGMGGAALASGDTFRGAMANAGAALGRLGEKVVGGVLPQIKDGFGDAIAVLDTWAPYAEKAGEAIGAGLSAAVTWITGTLIPAFRSVVEWLQRNRSWLVPLVVMITAAVAAYKAFMIIKSVTIAVKAAAVAFKALSLAMIANPIGLVVAAIAALVAGLVWFFTQTELGKQIWQNVWGAIQSAVQAVVSWWQTTVQPAFEAAWAAITSAAQTAAAWYQQHVAPVFEALGELFAAVVDRISQVIGFLWGNVVQPYLGLIAGFWSTVWTGIQAVWEKIGPPIMSAISTAIRVLQRVWSTVWNVIKTVFQGVWNGIKIVVETAMRVIKGVITSVTAAIKGDWSGAWNAIKGVFESIWDGMNRFVSNAIDTLKRTVGTIKQTILGVFSGAGNWLKDIGRKVIQGLIDGIKGAFTKVKDTLGDLTASLPDWKGPESVDRKLLSGPADDIMGGFVNRLEHNYGDVRRSLMGLTADLPSQVSVNANPVRADAAGGAPGGPFRDLILHGVPTDNARATAEEIMFQARRVSRGSIYEGAPA